MTVPLMLLPGWGFSGRIWQPLISALHEHGVRAVYAVDVPGFGAAYHEPAVSLDDVLAYIGEQLPQRCFLGGWSLGGMLAVQFASRYPERIAGVITLGSNLHFTQDGEWPGMPAADYAQFCERFEWQPEKTWRRFLQLQVQGDEQPEVLLAALQRLAQYDDVNPERALRALRWLGDIDNRACYAGLAMRGLHVLAAHDAITPVTVAPCLGQGEQQVIELPRCGHALPVSRAMDVSALIHEWMKS